MFTNLKKFIKLCSFPFHLPFLHFNRIVPIFFHSVTIFHGKSRESNGIMRGRVVLNPAFRLFLPLDEVSYLLGTFNISLTSSLLSSRLLLKPAVLTRRDWAESTLRLPVLPLDFARDGLRDSELAEPKARVCSGLILSGAFLPRLQRWGLGPPNGPTGKR